MHSQKPSFALAQELDEADSLGHFRERFYAPEGRIYLDGNSLGLLSRDAERTLLGVLEQWKTGGIAGWLGGDTPWFTMAEALAERVAKLIGAASDEVAIANSMTINLHQLLATLYRPAAPVVAPLWGARVGMPKAGGDLAAESTPERLTEALLQGGSPRTKVLIDAHSFPTDRYALRSHLRLRGLDPDEHIVIVPAGVSRFLDEDKIVDALRNPELQMALFPSVVYTTGQLLNLERICRAARENGVIVGLDLSHSVGILPHALDDWGADFAGWGHYKWLNAGPGSVAGLYLNRRHFAPNGMVDAGLAGWWSVHKESMFEMSDEFFPGMGASALQIGTPAVLSMAPIDGALQSVEEAGIERIREKSIAMTEFIIETADAELADLGFRIGTPREAARRGGHISLQHSEAQPLSLALRARGVVPDFRKPDVIRFAPSPLYNTFTELWEALQILKEITSTRAHEEFETTRALVT
ncbi:MAG: aminotransferase class V-fold PLP-dependent enzyme [Chthoniobacterales bacterium]|nr:aminotransferase class V-fold PLP-dependent enzyme [Chthoniobacterales bacterium]